MILDLKHAFRLAWILRLEKEEESLENGSFMFILDNLEGEEYESF